MAVVRSLVAMSMLVASLAQIQVGVVAPQVIPYDPNNPVDPFDTLSGAVNAWLTTPSLTSMPQNDWQTAFCSCMTNGYIASWYQNASAMYIIDTCDISAGFKLRTGHMQNRHREPLVAMFSCDMLKLTSYCLSMKAPLVLPAWQPFCNDAHYTVPMCDVRCSAAMPRAGSLFASALAVFAVAVSFLM